MIKKRNDNSNNRELLELGKKLQAFYDSGYVNKKQAIWFSFLKGLASGVGAFLGGTIVVALLLWILGLLRGVPFLSYFIDALQHAIRH